MSIIGKTRHPATSDHQPVDPSESDTDSDKENQRCMGNYYRSKSLTESSDDKELEQCEWF